MTRLALQILLVTVALATPALAQAPVSYRLSFPQPEHHWMQVEVQFDEVPAGTLEVHMSRSSPGRYAAQEFAKNVFDVVVDDGAGQSLRAERSNPSQWDVSGHTGTVRVRYRVFGDRADGTFLAVDQTHAHINIPASLMWARGLEARPVRVTFERPAALGWKVATQLHAVAGEPDTFVAANLQYLVDSPIELSNFSLESFVVDQQTFRVALHHDGTADEAADIARAFERIVREEAKVFGELPAYEGGVYTFLGDYLPYVSGDGMEHRNSTSMSVPGAWRTPADRLRILGTAAHEFFHCWNVERIRPRSLEPFRLDEASSSGELWFAEGFTNYYETVILQRTGLVSLADTAASLGSDIDTVVRAPGRARRSAEDMSRMAPFVDAAVSLDRTDFENTYISYYTWGSAIALGLDLSLRERSNGAITLDDYMRAMWIQYGKPGGAVEGVVSHPYTMQDLRDRLADVSHDPAFAAQFFDRFVEGREVVDYASLLANAGMLLRTRNPGRAWVGSLRLVLDRGTVRVMAPTMENTPVHDAGLDEGDEIVMFDGQPLGSAAGLDESVGRHKAGDTIVMKIRRRGVEQDLRIVTRDDPRLELVPTEVVRPLSPSERALRDGWLSARPARP